MSEDGDEASRLLAEGNDLEDRGRLDQAHALYLRAAAAAPAAPRPWLNIGNVLEKQGKRDDAIAAVRTALTLAPGYAPAHFNLGRLLNASGDAEHAQAAFRDALQYEPTLTEALLALADIAQSRACHDEAIALLRHAVAGAPAHPGALYNLALALIDRDQLDEAETLLQRALARSTAPAAIYGALGNVCMRGGRMREAEDWQKRRLEAAPDSIAAASAWLFCLLPRDDLTPRQLFDAHRAVAHRIESQVEAARIVAQPGPRLRIGYVSPDLRRHSVALFLHPVLAHHDRSRFEVFCYYSHRGEDDVTRKLRALAEHWRDIAGLSDDAAAAGIRNDRIDVLVDLAGYTNESCVALFARRCAPAQAAWLGYLHSTGLAAMDYRICDAHTDPPGETESLHSEKLVRMPHSQWCYEPMHRAAAPPAQRREGDVVLGAFNQFWKVTDRCLELWLAIAQRLPRARLRFVGVPAGTATQRLRVRMAARGIDESRAAISPRMDLDRYFAALAATDIALDSMPYNGATTTLDALWMGVPVVALAGDRPVARSSASILRALGLPELVAATPGEYVAINVRLVQDADWRGELRETLRDRLRASPLMDAAGFTRDLEARLASMVR